MPHTPSLPTPANPSAAGTTYHSAATIQAPAAKVWRVLMDFDSYDKWNTFTTRVSFPSAASASRPPIIGDVGDLDARIASPTATPNLTRVEISAVEVPREGEEGKVGAKYMICWKALGYPTWSLRPERVQEVEVLEPGEDGKERCEFRSWETMAGPLAAVVRRVVGGGLDGAFARMVQDLKSWMEGGMEGREE